MSFMKLSAETSRYLNIRLCREYLLSTEYSVSKRQGNLKWKTQGKILNVGSETVLFFLYADL